MKEIVVYKIVEKRIEKKENNGKTTDTTITISSTGNKEITDTVTELLTILRSN